jgi:Tfp pilus assembly protein PilO
MDLKNIDLKNINLEDIKAKFATIEKKTLIKYGVGFGAVVIFLIVYYSILNPIVNNKKEIFKDKIIKQDEINQMNTEIAVYKKTIKEKQPKFNETSKLFHSKAEVEGLYKSLSRYAGVNGLVISKIEKKEPKAVLKGGVVKQAEGMTDMKNISYYKIPVTYEIKGNFLGYIKFKRALAKSKKMLNFDKEVISIVQNDSTGAIVAKGELTIVGLPDEFF